MAPTPLLIWTIAIPRSGGQSPFILSNYTFRVPRADYIQYVVGEVTADIDDPTDGLRMLSAGHHPCADDCEGSRSAQGALYGRNALSKLNVICKRS